MKVGIIGAGAWGTALAMIAQRAGNQVVLWAFDNSDQINQQHQNSSLPGIRISCEIIATDKLCDLSDTDVWLIATPTEFFVEIIKKSRPFWKKQPIIICSKGIEPKTGKLLSDVVAETIKGSEKFIGVLAGPQFAAEAARGAPTGSTIAGSASIRGFAHHALNGIYLEESTDLVGMQICGSGKNAVAILMGWLNGHGAGENEKAMKLSLAWQEIIRFGRFFGAKSETFNMLCGLGDLFLTATSKTSRNYSAGELLARGKKPVGTIEGISALKWIIKTARVNKISMPILQEFSKTAFNY